MGTFFVINERASAVIDAIGELSSVVYWKNLITRGPTGIGVTLLASFYSQDCASDFQAVFTQGWVHSGYPDRSRNWLIWDSPCQVARSARRVLKLAASYNLGMARLL